MEIQKLTEEQDKNRLKTLTQKQRNLVEMKQNEIEALRKNFKTQKEDLKIQNEIDLVELTAKHQEDANNEIKRQEDYLTSYQQNLQNQKQLYDKTLEELRKGNEEELKNINSKHTGDLENKFAKNFNEEKLINNKINLEKKSFHADILREIDNTKKDEFLILQDAKFEAQKNIERQKAALSPSSSKSVIAQNEQTRLQHEKQLEIDRQAKMSHIAENQVKNSHRIQLEQEDKRFRENMSTQKALFEKKMQNAEQEHKEYVNSIQRKFTEEIKTLSQNHQEKKKVHQDRLHDSFYRVTKIEPQIIEKENEFHIALPIPEHEKDNVQLTAQGRKIHLGYTRRFNDSITSEDGSKLSAARSEAVAKEFTLSQILDPKKVTQKYEDGKIIFKVAKL